MAADLQPCDLGMEIPIVDFNAMSLEHEDPLKESFEAVKILADQVFQAFSTIGFVYLKNHGIPQETVSKPATTVIVCSITRSLSTAFPPVQCRILQGTRATSFAARLRTVPNNAEVFYHCDFSNIRAVGIQK